MQPTDRGVIEIFKKHYREPFIQGLISETDADLKQYNVYHKGYMYIAAETWNSILAHSLNKSWNNLWPTEDTAVAQIEDSALIICRGASLIKFEDSSLLQTKQLFNFQI